MIDLWTCTPKWKEYSSKFLIINIKSICDTDGVQNTTLKYGTFVYWIY